MRFGMIFKGFGTILLMGVSKSSGLLFGINGKTYIFVLKKTMKANIGFIHECKY